MMMMMLIQKGQRICGKCMKTIGDLPEIYDKETPLFKLRI
jgi:hypothetical protein